VADRRQLLTLYAKGIAFGHLTPDHLSYLLQYYLFSDVHTDVIKQIVSKFRERDADGCREAIMNGLQKMYEEAMEDEDPDLIYVKDIAHRIALTYGIAIKKATTRVGIVQMHHQGIEYAMQGEDTPMYGPSANIGFLEIVKEFSFKLMKLDKTGDKGVLAYLDEQMRKNKFKARNNEDWRSYQLFVANLKGAPLDEGKKAKASAVRSRGRPSTDKRKRQADSKKAPVSKRLSLPVEDDINDQSEDDAEDEDEDEGEGEDEDEDEDGSQYPASSQQSWIGTSKSASRKRASTGKGYGRLKTSLDESLTEDSPKAAANSPATASPRRSGRGRRSRPTMETKLFEDDEEEEEQDTANHSDSSDLPDI